MPAGGTSEAGSHCPSQCTENTAIPDSSSSSSSGFESVSLLFSSCPHWVWVTSWSIGRPEATERVSVFRPQLASSEQMLQLYRLKRLKGSVLLVGLTRNAQESLANAEDVPASLYRTLAHLLEMSRNGVPYSPVDVEGLQQGISAAHWARPLWTICEASLPDRRPHKLNSNTGTAITPAAGSESAVEHADTPDTASPSEGQEQAGVQQSGNSQSQEGQATPDNTAATATKQHCRVTVDDDDEDEEDGAGSSGSGRSDDADGTEEAEQDIIFRLLKSCPSWCYLYSHEPLKSKKTPPKTSAQMLEMYTSGCLPDWAPLLGLREEVAHFNSLPPSLFTTLAALVSVLKAGLELQPVGLVELQRYDKFIECRNHVGSTMRTPSHDKLVSQVSAQSLKVASNPSVTLPSSLSTPVDNLSPTLSALAPVSKSSKKAAAAAAFPAESPTAIASTGGWTPRGNAPSEAAGSEASGPSVGTHAGACTPTAPGVYPTMTPTAWLWGVPHMPFTYLTPASSPMHGGMTEQQLTGKATPGKRNAPNSPFSVNAGSRVSPAPGAARVAAMPQLPLVHQASLGSQGGAPAAAMGVHPMLVSTPGSPMHDPAMYAAAGAAGMWGWPGYPPVVMPSAPMPWTTPLFRLFTADSSRGAGAPAWWYMDRRAVGGRVGPLNCEAMILSYVRGTLADHHYVCGTHSDVTQAPPRDYFEELGKLLRQVEEGGEYVLVSIAEVMQQGPQQPAVGARGGAANGAASGKALNQRSRSSTLAAGQPPLPGRSSSGLTASTGRVCTADGAHDSHDHAFHNNRQRSGSRGNLAASAPPPPPPPASRVQNSRQPGAASSDSETTSHTHPSTDDASASVTSSSAGGGTTDPSNVFATQEAVAAAIAAVAAATSSRKSVDVSAHPAKALESAAGGQLGSQELSLQQLPELPCSCRVKDQVQKCSKGGACDDAGATTAGSDDDVAHPAARARTCTSCAVPRSSAQTSDGGAVPASVQAVLV